jgi:hypothetical protein
MNESIATRQRFWLVFLLFLHTVNMTALGPNAWMRRGSCSIEPARAS